MLSEHPWLENLRECSAALQSVLGAVLDAERHFAPPASPLERLHQITNSPEWAWLQPLYRLIADVDHALAAVNGELLHDLLGRIAAFVLSRRLASIRDVHCAILGDSLCGWGWEEGWLVGAGARVCHSSHNIGLALVRELKSASSSARRRSQPDPGGLRACRSSRSARAA